MSRDSLLYTLAATAVAAVIAVVIAQGWALGWWLLAAFLLGHACVHLFFVMPQGSRAAQSGRRFGLTQAETHMVGSVLMAAAAVAFLFAALLTVVASGLWGGVMVIACLTSLAMLAFFFRRDLIPGVALDLVLLVVAAGGIWHP